MDRREPPEISERLQYFGWHVVRSGGLAERTHNGAMGHLFHRPPHEALESRNQIKGIGSIRSVRTEFLRTTTPLSKILYHKYSAGLGGADRQLSKIALPTIDRPVRHE